MGRPKILEIKAVTDSRQGVRGLQQLETASDKFERRLGRVNRVAGVSALAIGALGLKARDEASALQQSSGAVQAVFGRQAKTIDRLSKQAADKLGLARADYQQMAAVFGSQLKNMGVAQKQLVPTTDKLLKLGGDLAATYGGKTSDAVEALGSLLRGERDPIEKYGVGIKQADINARLAAKGQDKLTGAARRQAETEATLAILYKQTAAAQGQRARESNTDAAQAERAQAKLRNTAASWGKVILPITTKVASGLAAVAGAAEGNQRIFTIVLVTLGALAAAVVTVNAVYRGYQATLLAVETIKKLSIITTAAQTVGQYALGTAWLAGRLAVLGMAAGMRLLNVAMATNPIGLVVLAIVALVAGLVLAYKKSATFRAIVQAAGRGASAALGWVVDKAKSVGTWLGKLGPAATKAKDVAVKAFKLYISPITLTIDAVKKLISWIKKIKFPKVPGAIKKLGGLVGLGGGPPRGPRTPPAAPGGSAPGWGRGGPGGSGMSVPVGGGRTYGGVTNIFYISGALDEEATAKRIRNILRRSNVRNGQVIVV